MNEDDQFEIDSDGKLTTQKLDNPIDLVNNKVF